MSPRFEDLSEDLQGVLIAVGDHIRATGAWPTVAALAYTLPCAETHLLDMLQRIGGDLVVLEEQRVGLTLKGTLIRPDSLCEAALVNRWVKLVAKRHRETNGASWKVSELRRRDTPHRRTAQLALARSEQTGSPGFGFVATWTASVSNLRSLLEDATPWTAHLLPMDSATFAAHLEALADDIQAGNVDRRRCEWLANMLARREDTGSQNAGKKLFGDLKKSPAPDKSRGSRPSALRRLARAMSDVRPAQGVARRKPKEARQSGPQLDLQIVVMSDRLHVTSGGSHSTHTADEMGLARKGRPRKAWYLLLWVALHRYVRMPVEGAPNADSTRQAIQKQVSLLNRALRRVLKLKKEQVLAPNSVRSGAATLYEPRASIRASDELRRSRKKVESVFKDWFQAPPEGDQKWGQDG